jgi:hypothetical protein
MTTINVTVENKSQAKQLMEWLMAIRFVKKTTILEGEPVESNMDKIQSVLSKIKNGQLYADVDDAVEFQKRFR